MPSPDLSDYVTVAQRIAQFRDKYPGGTLQPLDIKKPYDVLVIGEATMIVVVAAAYRSPEDTSPGVGMAAEPFPGRTPYTRGSELMNAETSAWGRAIVAALAADTSHSIASADEVRNRTEDRPADRSNNPADAAPWTDQPAGEWAPVTPEDKPGSSNSKQHQQLGILYGQLGITERDTRLVEMTDRVSREITSAKDLSYAEAEAAIKELRALAGKMSTEQANA
jgi:hypothetical protein